MLDMGEYQMPESQTQQQRSTMRAKLARFFALSPAASQQLPTSGGGAGEPTNSMATTVYNNSMLTSGGTGGPGGEQEEQRGDIGGGGAPLANRPLPGAMMEWPSGVGSEAGSAHSTKGPDRLRLYQAGAA